MARNYFKSGPKIPVPILLVFIKYKLQSLINNNNNNNNTHLYDKHTLFINIHTYVKTKIMNNTMDIGMVKKPKWKKILYENQGVPDNFADHTFLEELKRNCS